MNNAANNEVRRLSLCHSIEGAFAARAMPAGGQIADPPDDPEALEIQEQFRGKRWQEIPSELLFRERSFLAFSTPTGFCYYLPAFLIAVVEERDWWAEIAEHLLLKLVPPRPEAIYARSWREQLAPLRPGEIWAVKEFLEYIHECWGTEKPWSLGTTARQALDEFWEAHAQRNPLPPEQHGRPGTGQVLL